MALCCAAAAGAIGQVDPPAATPGDPKKTVPEQSAPPAEKKQGADGAKEAPPGTLSDQLSRGDGVIAPPKTVDPEIHVPAPVPNPGRMPVLPPPGSPGNPSPVRPK